MSLPTALRRYTPPTCTLELIAQQSALSRWAGQPVLKHLRFHLSFDDPRLPDSQWIRIKGDRNQLEALTEVVSTYVQRFLSQTGVPGSLAPASLSSETGMAYGGASSSVGMAVASREPSVATIGAANPYGISLQPRGLLSHELALGSLATTESGPTIQLSTSQLFDLATALEEYSTDVLALPSLSQPSWLAASPTWARVAAVALIAIGLSTSVLRLLDGSYTPQTASAPTSSQGASSSDQQQIALQPAPPSPTVTPAPGGVPPLASTQKLPPPPPPGSLKPIPPGLPTVTVPQQAPISELPPPAPTELPAPKTPSPDRMAARPLQIPAEPLESGNNAASDRQAAATLRASGETQGAGARTAAAAPRPSGTAFDTIPQVAEARQYFQQRWNPPEGLDQTLQYSLILSSDGSIQRIIPLGQVAGDFVDRSGIPLVGEPFVSPPKAGQTPRIRLVLMPDGKVQVFLESLN